MMSATNGSAVALAALATALGSSTSALDGHRALVDFLRTRTDATSVFISRYDAATRTRHCVHAWCEGVEIDPSSLPPLPLNEGTSSQAIHACSPAVSGDYKSHLRSQFRVDVSMHRDPHLPQSSAAVPVLHGGEVVGVVEVQSTRRDAFHEHHVAELQAAIGIGARTVDFAAPAVPAVHAEHDQAIARGVVAGLLRRLGQRAGLRPDAFRALGRELGETLKAESVDAAVHAYAAMGFGAIHLSERAPGRFSFEGRDLLERGERSAQPTCFFALGFLEGAVSASDGAAALGSELACESRGDDVCRFMVATRGARR